MREIESTLIVLIDAEDVKHAFAAWPVDICLAACLSRAGECSMVVFRRDEYKEMPQRLLDTLRLSKQDVCFVPQIQGFATKPFRYSDERRLMALVASDLAILEEAIDYAVNVTFAIEEGLDPAVVLGRKPVAEVARPRDIVLRRPAVEVESALPATRELSPLLPEFLRHSVDMNRRARFSSVRRGKPLGGAPHF